jgi:glycosyltransferase involved in cell wall biosynthesis
MAVTELKILAPTRYPWLFNGPRHTVHHIERRNFLPVNRIWKRFEAITVFNPLPPRRFDFVHAFNRIPVEPMPFIIGFESHLPRAYGLEDTGYFRLLSRALAAKRCKRIIAISHHALRVFREVHARSGDLARLEGKLGMRYPNIVIPDAADEMGGQPIEPLVLTFVGNHFGRKGGCVAVRLAEMALARGMPLQVNIVSNLEAGPSVWTDPERPEFFNRYFALLDLPNVRLANGLANADVQKLLRRSHFSILTTFSDTFGYSAIESMANWTPVLGTRQSALPEFIEHGKDGLLFDLPVTELGDWIHSGSPNRQGTGFEAIYADEVERLAEESFAALARVLSEPSSLMEMRQAARAKAVELFCSRKANIFWDELYQRIADDEEGWPDEAH